MKLTREFFVPAEFKEKIVKFDGALEVYIVDNGPSYVAKGFKGKAAKPAFHYRFKTAERMADHIDSFFADYAEMVEYKANEKAKAKAKKAEAAKDLKVGDIYYSSWGYDQTNIDFYKIVDVKGAKATLVEIAKSYLDSEFAYEDKVVPAPDVIVGKPMNKMVDQFGNFSIASYAGAYKWNGEPKSQTASGYGH
tara:strand:+ start:184 stop:762 length:579 start_codon:yes stop_codon:yes gene_type:complete